MLVDRLWRLKRGEVWHRTGEFEPQFIRKGQKRFGGFDTKIIAMYAQGMTVREIKRFLEEQYKVEVSSDLISTVTDSVLEDVIEWAKGYPGWPQLATYPQSPFSGPA